MSVNLIKCKFLRYKYVFVHLFAYGLFGDDRNLRFCAPTAVGALFNFGGYKMKNKLVKVLFVMAVAVVALSVAVGAATYGELTYNISNGEATITDCEPNVVFVEIPETIQDYPVRKIAIETFKNCKNLQIVVIPKNVKAIGTTAFAGCDNVTIYGYSDSFAPVFAESMDIPFVTLKDKFVRGTYEDLTYTISSDGEVTITDCADDVVYIEIPKIIDGYPVKRIAKETFKGCANLQIVVIYENMVSIHGTAFTGCDNLTFYGVYGSFASIFAEATDISFVILNNNYISGTCGKDVTWKLVDWGTLVISGSGDMYNYNEVTFVSASWYDYVDWIKKVVIEDGIESIGSSSFRSCHNLESVTISESVKNIGVSAFVGCGNLVRIDVDEKNQYFSSDEYGILFNKDKTKLLMCPKNSEAEKYTIPDTVTEIANDAFSYCANLSYVNIGKNVTTIGDYAFSDCTNLKSIKVDENNKDYSSDAYGVLYNKDKTRLIQYPPANTSSIYVVPDSVISIDYFAFEYCEHINKLVIKDNVTDIASDVFYECGLDFYCYRDSYAQKYADKNKISYVLIEKTDNFPGDTNGDGEITNRDAVRILQYVAGWSGVDLDESYADITGDGKINNRDATRVLQYLAGWNVDISLPEDANSKPRFKENLVIPTTLEGTKPVLLQKNEETGEDSYYVYAWIDGGVEYIPVSTDECPKIIVDGELSLEYEDHICTYTYENGLYTIKSMGYDVDDETNEYSGIEKEDISVLESYEIDKQFYIQEHEGFVFNNIVGPRYKLDGANFDRYIDLKPYTKLVVRLHSDEDNDGEMEYTYIEFLPDAIRDTEFINAFDYAEFIVSNNYDSATRENLVVMYAEMSAEDSRLETDRQNYRIITNKEKVDDVKGYWRYEYDVYNPYSGRKEIVPGMQIAEKASGLDDVYEAGAIVKLYNGFVGDSKGVYVSVVDNVVTDSPLLWVKSFDSDENCMTVVPADEISPADENCKECLTDAIESYDGGFKSIDYAYDNTLGFDENKVYVDENTAVNVVKNSDFESLFYYPTTSSVDASVLANPNQNYLCYNSKALDEDNNFVTRYADYLKVFVAADKKADGTCVADFVIIVVTDGEPSAMDVDCGGHIEDDETETQNTRQNYRIITNKEKFDDDNGDWRYEYDVYNPFTGRKEIVPGIQTATKASGLNSLVTDFEKGALVELKDGFVDDTLEAATIADNVLLDSSLLWVKSFDNDENCMTVVPVDDISPTDENCKECLTDALESYDGGFKSIDYAYDNTLSFDENKVYVDENTAVTVVKNSDFENLFYYPTTSSVDASVLANPNQNYLCYNSKALDEDNNFVTRYADYLKVFVAADKKADGTCVADFVIIVVTDGESSALNNSCSNH